MTDSRLDELYINTMRFPAVDTVRRAALRNQFGGHAVKRVD